MIYSHQHLNTVGNWGLSLLSVQSFQKSLEEKFIGFSPFFLQLLRGLHRVHVFCSCRHCGDRWIWNGYSWLILSQILITQTSAQDKLKFRIIFIYISTPVISNYCYLKLNSPRSLGVWHNETLLYLFLNILRSMDLLSGEATLSKVFVLMKRTNTLDRTNIKTNFSLKY